MQEWERKYNDLEKDFQALKLKMAAESEHWLTIQALFGAEIPAEEPQDTAKDNEQSSEQIFKEIGCNTENIPIPAERKLSATRPRNVSKEMVDKYVSPIQSPKKKTLNEIATQTEREYNDLNDSPKEETVKEQKQEQKTLNVDSKESKVESRKETSEAEIQVVLDGVEQESKAIQTVLEESEEKVDKEETVKESELLEALDKLKQTEER